MSTHAFRKMTGLFEVVGSNVQSTFTNHAEWKLSLSQWFDIAAQFVTSEIQMTDGF